MSRATPLFLTLAFLACSSNRPGNVSETCITAKDCSGGATCYLESSPGVCIQSCGGNSSCPTGTSCAALVTSVGDNVCLGSCTSTATCTAGNVCCSALGNVCTPSSKCTGPVISVDGSSLTCPARQLINGGTIGPATAPPDGTCSKPVASVRTYPGATAQAFGALQVQSTVTFDVLPGTGTISILQQVVDSGAPDQINFQGFRPNAVVPFKLIAPDGGVYFDDDIGPAPNADLAKLEVSFGSPTAAVASMTLPNTTQALSHEVDGYAPGKWTMIVNDFANECGRNDPTTIGCIGGQTTQKYDVTVVTKPIMGENGTIDLGIYLVTTEWTVKAVQADANGAWRRMFDVMARVYAEAGICLGKITLYDVPTWAKNAYAAHASADDNSPCSVLDQMFTLSQPGPAIPLFFVDEILEPGAPGGGLVVGIDGAIPGPSGAGGTVHSGALVNVSDIASNAACINVPAFHDCGADEVAYISAHESGHFMGLYHTTEGDGALFDPVSDTSQCGPSCDANGDGSVAGAECNDDSSTTQSCGGAKNTMFWQLSAQARGQFSKQQGQILRANPVIY